MHSSLHCHSNHFIFTVKGQLSSNLGGSANFLKEKKSHSSQRGRVVYFHCYFWLQRSHYWQLLYLLNYLFIDEHMEEDLRNVGGNPQDNTVLSSLGQLGGYFLQAV